MCKMGSKIVIFGTMVWLVACAELKTTSDSEPMPVNPEPLAAQFECIELASTLFPELILQEIGRLESDLRSLEAIELSVSVEQLNLRFCLACLLGRDGASDDEMVRSLELLGTLRQDLNRQSEQQLVNLLERTVSLARQLRQQQNLVLKLRNQNQKLKQKIEQLKDLERDLDLRSSSIERGFLKD